VTAARLLPTVAFYLLTSAFCLLTSANPSAQRRGGSEAPVALPRNTATHRNLPYVPSAGTAQQLDLYVPSARQPPPIVVVVHGGAWSKGGKSDERVMAGVASLLRAGLATASVSYRLSGEAISHRAWRSRSSGPAPPE
jgi:acetyl esterase/lipase